MSRKTVIINNLLAHVTASTSARGYRGLRFLHEINDFPAYYLHIENESRVHQGDGSKYAIITIAIRGYCFTDTLNDVEYFARQLETAIQTFKPAHRDTIQEARITSLRTDEGVMAPYGVIDMQLQVLYSVNN